MASDQLAVFISSSMDELAAEREVVWSALEKLDSFEPFAWEVDAGAHNKSARQVWTKQLADTDVCVVLLWKKVGEWTVDEIEIAMGLETQLLVYVKTNSKGELHNKVEKYLSTLEDPAKGRFISARFDSAKKLKKYISRDVMRLIKETFQELRERKVSERKEVTGSGRKLEKSDGDHGWKSDEEKPRTAGRRDPAEMRRMAPDRVPLVDRADETGKAREVIESGERFVAFTGEPGMGKKAILRHLANEVAFDEFSDGAGISPEQSEGEDLEDTLQAVWEEFFEAEELGQVEPGKRKRQLRGIESLIVLADVALSSTEMDRLVDAMPKAAFIVSVSGTTRPTGKRVQVGEFSDPEDLVRLFEARYHGPVPAKARSEVIELAETLDGNPGLISLLADLAWEEAEAPDDVAEADHPLIEWAAKYAAKSPEELIKGLVSPDSAEAVDVARAVAVHVPEKVLSKAASKPAIEEGLADRALEAGSPRYKAAPALVAALNEARPGEFDDVDLMDSILDSAVDWAENADADELFADRAFVLRMLRWGEQRNRWQEVLRLGRATSAAFARGGRWGSWRMALEHSLAAAGVLHDESSEAWARHQLGSRALVMDDLEDARAHLHGALEMRDRLGEADAAAVTRHNLSLVPLAVASVATLFLILIGIAGWLAVEFGPNQWYENPLTAIPDLAPEVVHLDGRGGAATVGVTNLGNTPFTIEAELETDCGDLVEPGESCSVTVSATDAGAVGFVDFQFSVDPEDAGADVIKRGDRGVIVVFEEEAP